MLEYSWKTFSGFGGSNKPDGTESCKILSYNVQNTPYYSKYQLNSKQSELFQFLKKENPDIICLQEFFSLGTNYYYPIIKLKEKLGAKNYYFESYFNPYNTKIVGW